MEDQNRPLRRRAFLSRCAAGAAAVAGVRSVFAAEPRKPDRVVLFDGSSLDAWNDIPRLPAPPLGKVAPPGLDRVAWFLENEPAYRAAHARASRAKATWTVQDKVLVGEQARPDLQLGGYLVTKETFGDFELSFRAAPDWGADTGVMLRASAQGSVGFQLLVDNRDGGSFGGFHGNGLNNFRATAWGVKAERDANGKPVRLVPCEGTPASNTPLAYACEVEEFIGVFSLTQANRYRVRCEGKHPRFTVWVNDLKVSEFDAAAVQRPPVDKDLIHALLGDRGHIALECHPNGPNNVYWAPGLKCRWSDVVVVSLA